MNTNIFQFPLILFSPFFIPKIWFIVQKLDQTFRMTKELPCYSTIFQTEAFRLRILSSHLRNSFLPALKHIPKWRLHALCRNRKKKALNPKLFLSRWLMLPNKLSRKTYTHARAFYIPCGRENSVPAHVCIPFISPPLLSLSLSLFLHISTTITSFKLRIRYLYIHGL